MDRMNEVFFLKDKYNRFKAAVIKALENRKFIINKYQHLIDSYCRDFFIDKMTVDDCIACIVDAINSKERQAVSESKRILRENGYRITNKRK
jgi:endonuclease III-like uncharacterized protein